MPILWAFAPFIVFAVIDRLTGPMPGLIAGAVIALGLLARDRFVLRRSLKILDVGTAILFTSLVLYTLLAQPHWSVIAVRLCVDSGLLLIVLASLAMGRPFTLQYAQEQTSPAIWGSAAFRKTNYVISGVWAAAFALMVVAELLLLYLPDLPPRVGIIIIVAALVGAIKFTSWYPEQVRARAN